MWNFLILVKKTTKELEERLDYLFNVAVEKNKERIKAAGGMYTRKPAEADVFVTYFHDSNGLPTNKCTQLKEITSLEDQKDVKIIDFKLFLAQLNVTENDLSFAQEIREDYFLSVREI